MESPPVKKKLPFITAAISPVVYLTGCQSDLVTAGPEIVSGTAPPPSLTILHDTLDPLRAHFNAGRNRYQFLAILSPT